MSAKFASTLAVLLFGLSRLSCSAQEPNARFLNKTEIALIAADSAARTMDWVSTEQGLNKGFKETQLPNALVQRKPVFALYEAGMVCGLTSAAYFAYRHHHQKLGWVLQAAEVARVSFSVKHNYSLQK